MIRTYIFLVIIVFNTFYAKSQKETNVWYFGNKAGLDFKSSPPTTLTNSSMNVWWSCGSISDAIGDLLFYTNGIDVWNKNHSIMSNGSGLNGDSIVRNGGLILKKPNSQSLYYVFSTNAGSIYYSVVDITLNAGLGSVITKNVLVTSTSDGSLAAARHSDCNNYWITTRNSNSNIFHSFLINGSGISVTPVTSICGTINNYPTGRVALKFSPNSKRLAGTIMIGPVSYNGFLGYFEIYDFNNSTGQISNSITIPDIRGPSHVEFSPNNLVLYGTSGIQINDQLYQFDLSQPTSVDIVNSMISLDSTFSSGPEGMKLANDGKIYTIHSTIGDSIGVIHNPNAIGSSCNYTRGNIRLNGRQAGFDFPQMLSSMPQKIQLTDSCQSDTTSFSLLDPYRYSFYSWNFGDSASGINNYSSLASPKHLFTGSGYFPIKFIGLNGCSELDTILDTIYIEPLPLYDLGNDTSICNGDTIILDASSLLSTYLWQDSTTDSVYYATVDTTYWVEVTNGCGSILDTIIIDYRNFDNTDLGNDTSVCPGDSLLLDATTPNASHYIWQDNSTDSSFLVTIQGTYSVEVGNGCDTLRDSIDVFYINPPAINLGNDTSRCFYDSITLDGKLPGVNYLWYNSDTTQTITTTDTGILWTEASNFRCSARDSIYISIYNNLFVDLGEDTTLCVGQTLVLDATQNVTHPVNYLWGNASSSPTLIVDSSGAYSIEVWDYCMTLTDTINVIFFDVPLVDLGDDTTICFGENIILDAGPDGATYLWHDNSTNQSNTVNGIGKYWVRVENKCGITSDTIVVSIRHAPNIFLGNDTTLCIDKTMTLDAYADDASYLWQDGSKNRYYIVKLKGEYWVDVTNLCATDNDSILAFYTEKPFIDLGNDTTICANEKLILDVTTEYANYTWGDGNKDSIRVIKESGNYNVEVINICGSDADDVIIEVIDCSCQLYIPNSFTPNSDEVNDVFEIQSSCGVIDFNITVYNRWGQEIFESKDIDFQWNGIFHNKEVPQENYVYSIQLTYRNGPIIGEKDITGRILLIR